MYNFIDDENPVRSILEHPFYEYLLEEDWKHSAEMQPGKCQQMCPLTWARVYLKPRNEQNLKTGEYKDLSEIHDTGISKGMELQKAIKGQKTGRFKHSKTEQVLVLEVRKSVDGVDSSVLDIDD